MSAPFRGRPIARRGNRAAAPSASILFFSGTGNTRHACSVLSAGLERAGWRAGLREIGPVGKAGASPGGAASGSVPARDGLLVLAFPVFAFGMPRIARRFVRGLPRVDGTAAAVLAVFGDDFAGPPAARRRTSGDEGGALDEAARQLARRGYLVQATRAVGYPASFTQFVQPPDAGECRTIREASDAAVTAWAADLAAGRHARKPKGAGTRLVSALVRGGFGLVGRRVLGKLYAADERCTSCGWCARACPAATIRMRGTASPRGRERAVSFRRLPRWGWRCESCQRCINGCPEQAIQVSLVRAAALVGIVLLPYGRWLAAVVPSLAFPGHRVLAWLAGTILATVAVDLLLRLLERVPGASRVIAAGYTRKFRRYRGPGG